MKRIASLASVMVLALGSAAAYGGQAASRLDSFVGVVSSVSDSGLTVEHGSISGTFAVESSTHVGAKGATAKTKANIAAGKAGLTVPDVVHAGDQVLIRYYRANGRMIASEILLLTPGAPSRSRNNG